MLAGGPGRTKIAHLSRRRNQGKVGDICRICGFNFCVPYETLWFLLAITLISPILLNQSQLEANHRVLTQ